MCGIAGIFNFRSDIQDEQEIQLCQILDRLKHRGPDSTSLVKVDNWAMIGATRLAITDPYNSNANMPFYDLNRRFYIVFNGEIYNHKDLRKKIEFPYRTNCDTETIMAAYMYWGKECVHFFEGMFAFAIYDCILQECFIAVDPSAQKPLFYRRFNDKVCFSSELDPLAEINPRTLTLDYPAIATYTALCYFVGGDTQYNEIKKIQGGSSLVITKNGGIIEDSYFQLPVVSTDSQDIEASIKKLSADIELSCRETFALEVPAGLLLSGGIDSSTIGYLAKRHHLELETFSIGFEDLDGKEFQPTVFNEFPSSRKVANDFSSRHNEILLSPSGYFSNLDQWVSICGMPLASREAPCIIELLKKASCRVRVLFTGSGIDEIFDGYGHGAILKNSNKGKEDIAVSYAKHFKWLFGVKYEELFDSEQEASILHQKIKNLMNIGFQDPIHATNLIDLKSRLQTYEHYQIDTISMNKGVESRSPLSAKRLIEFAFNIPSLWKSFNSVEKWIFRQAVSKYIPVWLVKHQKQGFPVPSQLWFHSGFEDRLDGILNDSRSFLNNGFFNRRYLNEIRMSATPGDRNVFYRLYILDRIISRQINQPSNSTRENKKFFEQARYNIVT